MLVGQEVNSINLKINERKSQGRGKIKRFVKRAVTKPGPPSGDEKKEKEEEEDSDEDSGEVEAEHLHFEGVDYGLLPNGDVYTEEGEYAGKWDPTKQKIMKEEEIAHEHLKHRLTFAPQELKGLEGCFEMIDEDKSGTLDFNEISKMLAVAGCIVKDEVLLDIFPNSATIGLTVREFINICSRYKDDPEKGPVIDSIMKSAERFALKTF